MTIFTMNVMEEERWDAVCIAKISGIYSMIRSAQIPHLVCVCFYGQIAATYKNANLGLETYDCF
jgi:hypothetical protein